MDPRATVDVPAGGPPDFHTLHERDLPSLGERVVVLGALALLASGDYVVFRDQLNAATGERPVNAVLLALAMVLGVQLLMHLVGLSVCLRRAGLPCAGPVLEAVGVVGWLGLCAAMFALRWVVPVTGVQPVSGQTVIGAVAPAAPPDPAMLLQQERFAWLCLALALVSGLAAFFATLYLVRPRARLRRRAEADLAAREDEVTDASAEVAKAQAALDLADAAVPREDELLLARRGQLLAIAEEAAELARLELIGMLGDPVDTTRITRSESPQLGPNPVAGAA